MNKFVNDIITGRDGESVDVGRVLWITGAHAFIGLSIYAVHKTGAFDPVNWGLGYGGLLGGGGAALKLKSATEPGQNQDAPCN